MLRSACRDSRRIPFIAIQHDRPRVFLTRYLAIDFCSLVLTSMFRAVSIQTKRMTPGSSVVNGQTEKSANISFSKLASLAITADGTLS